MVERWIASAIAPVPRSACAPALTANVSSFTSALLVEQALHAHQQAHLLGRVARALLAGIGIGHRRRRDARAAEGIGCAALAVRVSVEGVAAISLWSPNG